MCWREKSSPYILRFSFKEEQVDLECSCVIRVVHMYSEEARYFMPSL